MHRLNISYKQFYVTLNEIWLFESDPNAPSTWSERGGKQWQRSIRGRRNWDVELGPCAVIRHLCSVAFVWETKRPQADNSRSLIDRQVSCFSYDMLLNMCWNYLFPPLIINEWFLSIDWVTFCYGYNYTLNRFESNEAISKCVYWCHHTITKDQIACARISMLNSTLPGKTIWHEIT